MIDLIDEQIRYFGSSDLAYFARSIFSKSGGAISASELIDDVYEKLLKKKSPAGKSIESRLEQLVAAVFDKEIRSKSPDELRKFFRDEMKVGNSQVEAFLEMLKPGKSVGTVAMALIQTLGPATAKVAIEKVVLALITTFLGEQLAAVAVRQILSKGPAELLGPVVWVLSSAWVVYDIQGPAFRKTIPICLFLGLVALRDGMEPVSGAQA